MKLATITIDKGSNISIIPFEEVLIESMHK
jgi:hypothetical protein